jgi:Domain of unknown function (DUF4105)
MANMMRARAGSVSLRLAACTIRAAAYVAIIAAILWGVAAIWIDGPANRLLAGGLGAVLGVGTLALLILVRPWTLSVASALFPVAGILIWWLAIPPSNERDWYADVAQLPMAEIQGDRVTVRNVRNFAYPSPTFTIERWETRSYDLSRIDGLDLFLSYWGPRLYAHTIMSWTFADGNHLAISIETRKERGEDYSALLGFFRQFELYYVVADERDVIGVRAGPRREEVYLYRLRTPPEVARALLLDYLAEVNRLAQSPQWYHAVTHNCTTTIRLHAQQVAPASPFDWRILANGYLDELGYERGMVNTSLPFPELRRRSEVTARVIAADGSPEFSRRIREELPARPQTRRHAG